MTPDEFASWLAKEKLSGWQGGPDTAQAWAQCEVDAAYRPGSNGPAVVSSAINAASLVFECWARSDLRTMGRISDALADELLTRLDDWGCDYFARSLVHRAATEGPPLPRALHPFANENIGRKSRRDSKGTPPWRTSARDHVAAQILAVLTAGFGLHALRNEATETRTSACDVLAKATEGAGWWAEMRYASAAKVWGNRARLWKDIEVMCRVKQFWDPPFFLSAASALELLAELDALSGRS